MAFCDEACCGVPPWNTGRPRHEIAAPEEAGEGREVRAGPGLRAIETTQTKAWERGVDATFLVRDNPDLPRPAWAFDTADPGFFHTLPDGGHLRYVRDLAAVLRPEGGSSWSPSACSSRPVTAPAGGRRRKSGPCSSVVGPSTGFESRVRPEGLRSGLSKVVKPRRRHRDDGRLAPDRVRTFFYFPGRVCVGEQ